VPDTLPFIVSQHADLAAHIWGNRRQGVAAPHWALHDLSRFDGRVEANLDGLRVAGDAGWRACEKLLEQDDPRTAFVAGVLAIEAKDRARIGIMLNLAHASPSVWAGLGSALAWVSGSHLAGTAKALLDAKSASLNRLGITACTMHRVDPGVFLDDAIAAGDSAIRVRALEAMGKLGHSASLPAVLKAMADAEENGRRWGAWSAVMLGDRGAALEILRTLCARPSPQRAMAMNVALRVLDLGGAHALLRSIAHEQPKDMRMLIQGVGMVGDPHLVPWLMEQMADLKLARLAGESFSFVTGVDLANRDLDRPPPEDFDFGANDDPEEENVAMDPDEGLPWPDLEKLRAWWDVNRHRFPVGVRHFMGEPPNPENCQLVLRDGYQRQRIAAALYLALLRPGTPLFPTSAPAWRQKRWLA
jgi:uncharacterized protein (TIGR02270 family)